ncbi:dnaJ homolog subfamily C member 4 [Periplaneta americana]|uniref:dnaJ homolog subfamily C member 4 n=1 Tax=Periplaneta americana TaxID=6978 RepID=UPI0037E7DF20
MSNQILISLVSAFRTTVHLSRNIFTYRIVYGTHYDTLQLPRNCTNKDVRDSFIKLSKQFHPDKNQNDPNTHAQFVKLNEAYHVLSRPDRRRDYDLTLQTERHFNRRYDNSPFDTYTTAYRQRVVWRDESFWEFQDKTKYNSEDTSGYYGIKGVRRVPNSWIAVFCIIFSAIGLWLQVLLIRESTAFNRKRLNERSEEASKILADVQEQALIYGNKVQLERMRQRLNQSQFSSDTMKKENDTHPPQETANISEIHQKNIHSYSTGGTSAIAESDTEFQNLTEEKNMDQNSSILGQTTDKSEHNAVKSLDTKSLHDATTSNTSTQEFVSMQPKDSAKPHFEMMVGNGHDIKITNQQHQQFDEKLRDFHGPQLNPEVIVMTEPGEVLCEMHIINRLR